MTYDRQEAQLMEDFSTLADQDIEQALTLICSMFVNLYAAYVQSIGGNPDEEIKIESLMASRDVTIHPSKLEHIGHSIH